MAQTGEWIRVRGARVHNLQNLDVDLPQGGLSVLTGPSGSGKSSLAFDTLHAEGQRRYLETLRLDTRALFDQLQRPDVDLVEGLPPTLCVSQHTVAARPRSTLATITEIHDHLRLLWARLGTPYCYRCDVPIQRQPVCEIVRQTLAQEEGRKIYLLAPLVSGRKGEHREVFQQIRQLGFLRARVDGVLTEVRDNPPLNPRRNHTVELVVDRLVVRPGIRERLAESVETAVKHGGGTVIVTDIDEGDWRDHLYSTRFACRQCGLSYSELEPRSFSFNSPYGACPTCSGLGQAESAEQAEGDGESLQAPEGDVPCPECGGSRLNREARSVRFAGKGIHEVTALSVDEAATFFGSLLASAAEFAPRRSLRGSALTAEGAEETQRNAEGTVPSAPLLEKEARVGTVILQEIVNRLGFLQEVGLGYLALDRPAPTLSGGEAQRARLATHLGGGLLGVCYILDEPTIGLHPRDTDRLLGALRGLQQRGNTVIVVEHDEAVIRQADYLVDIGPGAGKHGGRVVAAGSVADVLANPGSVTAPYLQGTARAGERRVPGPASPPTKTLTIRGARHHNLKSIDVPFPLGRLVCVTGVSGSGKSSLVQDILGNAVRRRLGLLAPPPGAHGGIDGLEHIDKVIEVDQSPLGRSSRSSPATYTGMFDEIRKVFASTRLARLRGYTTSRFSFNVKGGRCEECQGQGSLRVALQFLPDLTVPCPLCHGRRFNRATLEVTYRGRSIADVLNLPAAEALEFFANIPALLRPLQALADVGLGYLTLGQPSSALSGGEAQRVKLAAELARTVTGQTLFLLDEPTTGLHFADVARLLGVLRRLVDAGNTVVVIEHNLEVIASADWLIDLGPEGGAAGGYLVAAGTPEEVAGCPASLTGKFLREKVTAPASQR